MECVRKSEYYLCWQVAECLPIYLFHFYKNMILLSFFCFKLLFFLLWLKRVWLYFEPKILNSEEHLLKIHLDDVKIWGSNSCFSTLAVFFFLFFFKDIRGWLKIKVFVFFSFASCFTCIITFGRIRCIWNFAPSLLSQFMFWVNKIKIYLSFLVIVDDVTLMKWTSK